MKRLLSGNEALALGAYHAGVAVATAYPGTPSTEILEHMARMEGVHAQWSVNEKVALEVALGAAMGGVRVMASMKHVGLNVAADPFFAASTTGISGGLVVVSCDDPGEHSSQGEQDNRHIARFAKVPMLEPTDSDEAYHLMDWAFKISEEYDTPTLLRATTRISHCKTVVEIDKDRPPQLREPGFLRSPTKWVMVPSNARPRRTVMEDRIARLQSYVEDFPMNEIIPGDRKLGVISSGVAYQYAREVFKKASHLKLVTLYPLPLGLIRRFAGKVDQVVVIEELDPYIEDAVRSLSIAVRGKDFIPIIGELNPEIVEQAAVKAGILPPIERPTIETTSTIALPARRPQLCAGCPHVATEFVLRRLGFKVPDAKERALRQDEVVVTSDIGCYTLGVYPPLAALDTCACMGASIGQALGMNKAGVPNKTVAVLGDSTFMHSGITGLVDTVYNEGNSTVIILDNATTAMTGHQGHPGTGISASGKPATQVKLEEVCRGVGVEDVNVVDAFDIGKLESTIKRCIDSDAPSVVIARGPCSLRIKEKKNPYRIDADECVSCDECLDLGCPAIIKTEDAIRIDADVCIGCGVCSQVCPQEAIVESE